MEQKDIVARLQACGVMPASPLIIGVSGGADSLCLLHVLSGSPYTIIAAHFDHRLRKTSAQDAEFVEKTALELGVSFIGGQAEVQDVARENGWSIEEAARIMRYRFLFNCARQAGAGAVLVAHTADDQVETMLMHLLRGAGLSGLRGMEACAILSEWDDQIALIRPLLETWRVEIDAYCAEHRLTPLLDQTNADTTYFRNRLRHQLIPTLQEYNPNIKQILWRTSRTISRDYAILEQVVDEKWQTVIADVGAGRVSLYLNALQALPDGMLHGVVRKAIGILRPDLRDIGFDAVERAAAFIRQPARSGFMDLINHLHLHRQNQLVILANDDADLRPDDLPRMSLQDVVQLSADGGVHLGQGWLLECHRLDRQDLAGKSPWLEASDPTSAWLDADQMGGPLMVRTRQPGERFRPLGMKGRSIKLSDFFVNVHIPVAARESYPLVCSGDEIVWVVGLRQAETCRVTDGTTRLIHLRIVRSEEENF